MIQWEYKIEQYDTHKPQERLNELGRRGWELVSVYTADNKLYPFYHFKRPIPETKEQP